MDVWVGRGLDDVNERQTLTSLFLFPLFGFCHGIQGLSVFDIRMRVEARCLIFSSELWKDFTQTCAAG